MIINNKLVNDLEIQDKSDLYKLKGLMNNSKIKINVSQIARDLNIDRRTAKKYINGFKKSTTKNKKSVVDNYYDLIDQLLSSDTQIFYYKRILWQYLTENHDLKCTSNNFSIWMKKHDEFQSYFDSKQKRTTKNQTIMRYETPPGKQAQLDWKESMKFVLSDGEIIVINIFVCILSYSRFRVYRLSLSKEQDVLFNFLDETFIAFGGVPEELLTDNMKTVMKTARTPNYKGKVNDKFQQFSKDYGFKVRPCVAARPETKSKVESPMRLLDELYAYSGTLNYDQLAAKVEFLNNRKNSEWHEGTGKIPILHVQKERDLLLNLPRKSIRNLYQIKTVSLKVTQQSLISYKSHKYSVPPKYIGKTVKLQVYDNRLHLYYQDSIVAIHEVSDRPLNYLETHYLEITKLALNSSHLDVEKIAKENLKNLGMLYEK